MDFIKRQLFLIVCGLVGVFGIVIAVLGIMRMGTVNKEMEASINLVNNLASMAKPPSGAETVINSRAIANQESKIAAIEKNHADILELAHGLNRWEPLIPDAFPLAVTHAPKTAFKQAYPNAFKKMLQDLKAGGPPNAVQIKEAEMQIKAEEDIPQIGAEAEKKAQPTPESWQNPDGSPTEAGARRDARVRASIAHAKNIFCYATEASFDILPVISQGIVPDVRDMWDAQVAVWIQQEVVAALSRVNSESAAKIEEAGGEPWVGVLPVKDLISIRLPAAVTPPYLLPGDVAGEPAVPGGTAPALPPSGVDVAFTKRASGPLTEVVQFTVKMVVDVRDLPTIIGEICKDRFFTVLRVSYAVEPPNISMVGKIYGPEPVVNTVIDFEAHMFGDLYRPLMPDVTREALKLPPREKAKEKA